MAAKTRKKAAVGRRAKTVATKPAKEQAAPGKRDRSASSKAAAKPSPSRAKAAKKPPAKKPPAKKATRKKGVSPRDVHLGHVFALRPRVNISFKRQYFHEAKLRLEDESYSSLEEAARAVVEKALELTHEGPPRRR